MSEGELKLLDVLKERVRERLDPELLLDNLGVTDYSCDGVQIRCKCPIHKGDGLNFSWNLEADIWTCFSHHCGEDVGLPRDAFLLVMIIKGYSFSRAVKYLASMFGIDGGGEYSKEERDLVKIKKWLRLQDSLERRENNVLNPKEILSNLDRKPHPYLLKRNFTEETIQKFELGYARSGPLAGRIVVPIRNEHGELVGASGRLATDDKNALKKHFKYKHTVDFSSGSELYWLHAAKPYIEAEGVMVLVEGFFDVASAWQNQLRNVCATMGTTILPEQIDLVVKHTDTVYLAYDGDVPGRKAGWKIYQKMRALCDVKFLDIPNGEDIGSLSAFDLWSIYSKPMVPLAYYEKYQQEIESKK